MKIAKNSDRLGTESIVPLLFRLSLPSIIAMAVQALYNVVDSIYIGRLSTDALSALSLCFPIQIIIIGIGVGTGVGTSSLISRLLGKGKKERASNAAEHVLIIAIIYSVIMALISLFFSDIILYLFTDNLKLIEMGTEYISVILLFSIAMFIPTIGNNILRGEGNTVMPMIVMLIGAVINIILDPFLIFGWGFFPQMGIKGAAIATITARAISGGILLYFLFSDKNEIQFNFKYFSFDFSIIKAIYRVGFPAMVMQFMASIMLGGMNRILSNFSSTAVAAAGIYFRLQSFVFMPIFGLNQGYMPLVGYNYGHQKPKRMKKSIKTAFAIAFIFTTTGFIIFQIMPEKLILMFNNDPKLIEIGTTALKTISLAFPIIGPAIIVSTTFQAIGKGLPSLIQSFTRQIVVLLPMMYLLGNSFGLDTLWYAFPISEGVNAVVAGTWLYYTLNKVFRKMQNLNKSEFKVE
ncbi:MAG: MATE family efflux transporter [Halanaerobiales bacterium]